MNKIKQILTAILGTLAAILAGLFLVRKSETAKAGKAEGKAEAYEEEAERDRLLAVEEITRFKEEQEAAKDIANSIDPMKSDPKPNSTRKRFSFK